MSVVLVDWLGRGGIAQVTDAWALELATLGLDPVVVTRPGRELAGAHVRVAPAVGNRLRAHAAVAAEASRAVLEVEPAAVVVQNYVVPVLEEGLFRTLREQGTKVVFVVHDDRPHQRAEGSRLGLRRRLRNADVVVAHTRYVADSVARWTGRSDVVLVPHPVQVGMLTQRTGSWPLHDPAPETFAVHFGIVHRSYKGTDVVTALARRAPDCWSFLVVGPGAPPSSRRLTSVDTFVPAGQLVDIVSRASATLLPYRVATQSGAVVLSQAVGTVPIATAVGGIPEQIDDGVTGLLLRGDAGPEDWEEALRRLSDPAVRHSISATATEHAWAEHRRFVEALPALVD